MSGQDRDVPMSQSSGHGAPHNHYAGQGMCVRCNPGWHVIPDPSNAIMGCDDCGHARQMHSSEPGIGCLHRVRSPRILRVLALVDDDGSCDCLSVGSSAADQ